MAQATPRFCPRCGNAMTGGQRFCARCGLDLSERVAQESPRPAPGEMRTLAAVETVQRQPPQIPQTPPLMQPAPLYPQAQPIPNTYIPQQFPVQPVGKKGRWRLVIAMVLVLLTLGAIAYFARPLLSLAGTGGTQITINSTATYAGVELTVLNVEKAQQFGDDPQSSTSGMVRIHMQAQNKTTTAINILYTKIARLIVPLNKTIEPIYVQSDVGLAPGATKTSFIDFAVPNDVTVAQTSLKLGAANEEQIEIPLTGKADLTKYSPKATTINKKVQYQGLNWTLATSSEQFSIAGKQADKGMRYVVLTLQVANPLAQTVIPGSAYDYMRLQAGGKTATPQATTLPVSYEAGATGKSGTVTFLVPQNEKSLALILLAQQGGFEQVTIDFSL